MDDFYSALEAKEKEIYWARIEEERIKTQTINFDEWVKFASPDYYQLQSYIDKGYLSYWGNDYWHHNEGKFLELFLSIKEGNTVIIGGTKYIADSFEYGIVSDEGDAIYGYKTGRNVFLDSNTDIITCNGPIGTMKRQIWHLKKSVTTAH